MKYSAKSLILKGLTFSSPLRFSKLIFGLIFQFSFFLSDRVGCYRNFPSSLLQDLRNDISWSFPPFSKQMDKIVKKCAHLAKTKRMRFFGVENYGNCYGVQSFSPGNQLKTNRCNYGVGLRDNFYVYEITE